VTCTHRQRPERACARRSHSRTDEVPCTGAGHWRRARGELPPRLPSPPTDGMGANLGLSWSAVRSIESYPRVRVGNGGRSVLSHARPRALARPSRLVTATSWSVGIRRPPDATTRAASLPTNWPPAELMANHERSRLGGKGNDKHADLGQEEHDGRAIGPGPAHQ
jgi:hypothetical protein